MFFKLSKPKKYILSYWKLAVRIDKKHIADSTLFTFIEERVTSKTKDFSLF